MRERPSLDVLTAVFLFLFSVVFFTVSGYAAPGKADRENILETYGKLPLYFIENKGQLDPKVRFYVKTSGQTLYFTGEGIVFDLLRREKKAGEDTKGTEKVRQGTRAKKERLVFNLEFENARSGVLIGGIENQDAMINYFVGNDRSKWKRDIPTYKGIVYKGIYKGIDLKVFGNGKDIEYEFIVSPGGNPGDILLTYNGIKGLATNREGELLIATAFGELKETKPYIYQEVKRKSAVDGSFKIQSPAGKSQTGKFSYGFQVASYNPSYPLIIDPTLRYSTYLGGSSNDWGAGIAVDGSGNAYVTGETDSLDFPTQDPYQGSYAGGMDDAFITKFSSSGSALTYSTYLGGSEDDVGKGIAIDSSGNAYVTGQTYSTDFPTQDPYQGSKAGDAGSYDAFITKLSSSGSALTYSTYLGGSESDGGIGIAVDGSGNAYVTGFTYSTDFPTQDPYQGTYADNRDAFITKLSSSGSALSYSTYLGGSIGEIGNGIAVDGSGNAYVTGQTGSSDFPTQDPYQGTNAGGGDAFITRLSSSGSALSYSTYLGGANDDGGNGIAVDGSGNAYVTGQTYSTDFPTQDPYQGSKAGDASFYDAFITKLSPSGSALSYSTYLGGANDDGGNGIAVDGSGNAYVTGQTYSTDFPTQDPYQGSNAGRFDAFVTKFSDTAVTTGAATDVTQTSAILNGTVNPNGESTNYYFEYGADTSYGSTTESTSAGSGTTDVSVSVEITGLTSGTTYHFRLVATNSSGTTYGIDVTFVTDTGSGGGSGGCFISAINMF